MPSFLHTPSNTTIHASGARARRLRRHYAYQELPYSPPDAPESPTPPPDNPATPPLLNGTVTEILEWAGTDPQRRAAALQAEHNGKQRVTLIRALQS